jgi:hypothetical protein
MTGKPSPDEVLEIRRLILEKMVMAKNWGHNHIEEDSVPRGLKKIYNREWYHDVKHELKRGGWLVPYKEHGKDLYALNIKRKKEIEQLVGGKVTDPMFGR